MIAGGVVEETKGPPSREKVYGPVPLFGVTVNVPLATAAQVASVNVPTPVMPAPSYTYIVLVPVHPVASEIVTE